MIISDLHIPYEDKSAVNVALKIHQRMRPAMVIVNGDLLDFPQISHFTSDPANNQTLGDDINAGVAILKKLQRYSKVVFLEGNHEIRMRNYILDNAPELYEFLDLKTIFENKIDDLEYIQGVGKESMYYYDNDLLVGHFNKVSKHAGYTAKLLVDQYRCNVVQGHTHRVGVHFATGFNGTIAGYESGCLCSLEPQYISKPNWQQAVLMYNTAVVDSQKITNMEVVRIQEGKALYRGKLYRG